jgi:hypothetical protein
MSLKSSISSFAVMSVLLTAPPSAIAQPETSSQARPPRADGFCVNAPPLPQLANETHWVQQQQSERTRRVMAARDGERAMPSLAMEPPPAPPPPPPPSALSSASAGETDGVVVTASRAPGGASKTAREDSRVATTSTYPPRRPQPYPQAGLLTAGEHDDLLNPELYARYVKASDLGQAIRDLPVVDTRSVLTVEVKDGSGRPVPFAEVRLTCSDGNSLKVATLADGRAVFFPGVDRLSPNVSISASKAGSSLGGTRTVQIDPRSGGQQVTLLADRGGIGVRKLDLMLVVDTTGSMQDELRFLQTELRAVVDSLVRRHQQLDIRVGFVFYRDEGDDYVTHSVPFDARMARIQSALGQQYATGGGDYPEAMDQALIRAVGADWRPDAAKSLLLVADAPPHDNRVGRTWLAARVAREKRIQITPVAASGVADTAEYAMRAMAALTQSRYLFLTDDSGVGNPHAPPAVDCYLVTRLDALLRRVIDSQISGRRIEPDKAEIIRTVGEYDAGRCVLPRDFAANE